MYMHDLKCMDLRVVQICDSVPIYLGSYTVYRPVMIAGNSKFRVVSKSLHKLMHTSECVVPGTTEQTTYDKFAREPIFLL